jgi:hypothetical protein
MPLNSEAEIAWELVECIRSHYTVAELNSAYVNLGVGEFGVVIQKALTVVEREQLTVPTGLAETLDTWRGLHFPSGPGSELLARQIAQCRHRSELRSAR